jgi:hypothetical protein
MSIINETRIPKNKRHRMPIEIKELQIVTVVTDTRGGGPAQTADRPAAADTDHIIAACVEQVMEILQQKNER